MSHDSEPIHFLPPVWRGPEALALPMAGEVNWGMEVFGINALRAVTNGAGIKIGVVDTGIDPDHPLLTNLKASRSFVPGESARDGNGHGSHVSGTVGATDPRIGCATGCDLYHGKGLSNSGSGGNGLLDAIEWCVEQGCTVVSNSWGGGGQSADWERRFKALAERGIWLIFAGGNCLAEGQHVWTPAGPIPIEQLQAGDDVWSYDDPRITVQPETVPWKRAGGTFTTTQVSARVVEKLVAAKVVRLIPNGVRKVFKLRTKTREIVATSNHPFLAYENDHLAESRERNHRLVWKELSELSEGDRVVIQRDAPSPTETQAPVSEAFAEILGFWLGDGWLRVRDRGRGEVSFAVPDGPKRDRLIALLNEVFPGVPVKFQGKCTVSMYRRALAERFLALGMNGHATTKRIPDWVFSLPETHLKRFVDGYIAADGYRETVKSGWGGRSVSSINFMLANEGLARQLRFLCVRLGYRVTTVRERVRADQKIFNGRKTYSYATTSAWVFRAYPSSRSQSRGVGDGGATTSAWKRTEHLGFERIISIECVGERTTFDIEVEGTHNFVAEGLVVHNSGPNTPDADWPGRSEHLLNVAALDSNLKPASFSSAGNKLDTSGPGVNIWSCKPGGGFAQMSGTSMATPYVAGLLGLFRRGLELMGLPIPNVYELRALLQSRSTDTHTPGDDRRTGPGWVSPVLLRLNLVPILMPVELPPAGTVPVL